MSVVYKFVELIIIGAVFIPLVYYSNLLGVWLFTKKRNRGFERISELQWNLDTKKIPAVVDSCRDYWELEMPKRATASAAGYDVFSPFKFTLEPNESISIPTGFKAYMNVNEKLSFYPRSGLGFKYFIRLANTVGVGDSDYFNCAKNEGHYWVKIRNEGSEKISIEEGDAITQCIFNEYLLIDDDDYSGEVRVGGFGSTNKK